MARNPYQPGVGTPPPYLADRDEQLAPRADQLTLRVAASLGGEQFEIAKLVEQFTSRNANATQQSVNRLLKSNHVYRVRQGAYAYTAPLFGDFLRRRYPRHDDDR